MRFPKLINLVLLCLLLTASSCFVYEDCGGDNEYYNNAKIRNIEYEVQVVNLSGNPIEGIELLIEFYYRSCVNSLKESIVMMTDENGKVNGEIVYEFERIFDSGQWNISLSEKGTSIIAKIQGFGDYTTSLNHKIIFTSLED